MIRNRDVKAHDIYNEFTVSVAKLLAALEEKYDELKASKESERTFAFHTDKMIRMWFNKRGGTSL